MNSQPNTKTGIIYLIVNIENYVNNVLPYLYIGSKEDESKFATYWSSSKYVKADVQKLGKQNFIKIVLRKVEYNNPCELLEVEQQYHNDLNVVENEMFYNKSYANGKMVGGAVTTTDTVWINNSTTEKRVKVSLVEKYLAKGYVVGRQQNYNKGRSYINKDGTVKSVSATDVDKFLSEGWTLGRLKGNQTGKTWIHNDTARKLVPSNKVAEYEANGWTVGCFREDEKLLLNKK